MFNFHVPSKEDLKELKTTLQEETGHMRQSLFKTFGIDG